jgi:hypothetical protein
VDGREFDVLPHGPQFPAVEVVHDDQNLDLADVRDQLLDGWLETFIILFRLH